REPRSIGEKAVREVRERGAREWIARTVEYSDVGTSARPGGGNDFVVAVPVEVSRRHPHTASDARAVREEVEDNGAGRAAKDTAVGAAAAVGADNHVLVTVAVDITTRHPQAPGEAGIEGEEVEDTSPRVRIAGLNSRT